VPQQAAGGAWDPFTGGTAATSSPPQQHQQQQPVAAAAEAGGGWGDLTDADIWGDQKGDATSGKRAPASNSDDDEVKKTTDIASVTVTVTGCICSVL
jgi:hypothetical protein